VTGSASETITVNFVWEKLTFAEFRITSIPDCLIIETVQYLLIIFILYDMTMVYLIVNSTYCYYSSDQSRQQ
jgi:hypothetical protein